MVDSITSNIWLIGKECTNQDCISHDKIDNYHGLFSRAEIQYIGGRVEGFFDLKKINLGNFIVQKQPVLIANKVYFQVFKVQTLLLCLDC